MTDTFRRANRDDLKTHLKRTARVGDTDVVVFSTSGFSDAPGRIKIEGERIWYFTKTEDTFGNCVRGADLNQGGSIEQEHTGGTVVIPDNPDDTDLAVNGALVTASSNLSFEDNAGITWVITPDTVNNRSSVEANISPPVMTIRTNTSGSIANNSTGSVTVTCNVDEVCTGGGFTKNSSNLVSIYFSFPNGNGWTVAADNRVGSATTVTAYALCAKFGV